eukprot:160445_1
MIVRVLGNTSLANQFKLELINVSSTAPIYIPQSSNKNHPFWSKSTTNTLDIMQLDNDGTNIILRGSSTVALGIAFNWYLQDIINTTYDWQVYTVNIPSKLPLPSYQQKQRSVPFMYYQNTCTSSYTFAFWNWNLWEKHIDWMILQGVNIPLSFTGQEYIFSKMFASFGFTTNDLSTFFSGPGFYAWQRMGNIQGWGGPLRESEIMNQYNLQLKILARMYSFNMQPILTCFAGHVPQSIIKLYPNASVTKSPTWAGFPTQYTQVYLLNSSDSLFTQMGSKFIELQTKYFNTSHLYQCDTFNEMLPPSNTSNYLKQASAMVYNSMNIIDNNSIWLIQSWLFSFSTSFWNNITVSAYLSGIPNNGMIILDLQAEVDPQYPKWNSFYGKPFIWCDLHNPGGRNGMMGNLPGVNDGFIKSLTYPNTTVVGVGTTMEGIWQNYITYDMVYKMGFHNETNPINITQFGIRYAYRRYGLPFTAENDEIITQNIVNGWSLLVKYLYTINTEQAQGSLTCDLPGFGDGTLWYNAMNVQQAWKYFISVVGKNNKLMNVEMFQYDLVDLTRQALSDLFNLYYQNFSVAYKSKNEQQTVSIGNTLIDILTDMDSILNTNKNWMLGQWIQLARNQTNDTSNNNDTKNWYEFNARNLITIWGPNGQINNYASKQWGDIIGKYYKPQWQMFVNQVVQCMKENKAWDQGTFDSQVYNEIELPFQNQTGGYNIDPIGDTAQVACDIYKKWNLNGDTSCI